MKTVLALDPGFLGTMTGTYRWDEPAPGCSGAGAAGRALCATREIAVSSVPAGNDPFEAAEARIGGPPSIVAAPGGLPEAPWHPLSTTALAARQYCSARGIPFVEVPSTGRADLAPEARLSGHKDCPRQGRFRAIPQRAAFEKVADMLGVPRGAARLVTVYLGDEVAVASHVGSRVVDTSDAEACEGPFGLTSMGTPPSTAFVSWAAAQMRPWDELRSELKGRCGVFGYAGVTRLDALKEALDSGQEGAARGVAGMAYQVSKEIGRQMAALSGLSDGIALCGPGASLERLVFGIRSRVAKWCRVVVIQEDLTMQSLVGEGIRALSNED